MCVCACKTWKNKDRSWKHKDRSWKWKNKVKHWQIVDKMSLKPMNCRIFFDVPRPWQQSEYYACGGIILAHIYISRRWPINTAEQELEVTLTCQHSTICSRQTLLCFVLFFTFVSSVVFVNRKCYWRLDITMTSRYFMLRFLHWIEFRQRIVFSRHEKLCV